MHMRFKPCNKPFKAITLISMSTPVVAMATASLSKDIAQPVALALSSPPEHPAYVKVKLAQAVGHFRGDGYKA